MVKRSVHVSDDRLVEVCVGSSASEAEQDHFAACVECEGRRSRLETMLREVSDAATVEADAAFPEERLATQRTRIMQRIEQDGRPARVIAFPAGQASDLRPLRTRPAGRWIAGAAAAGLAIGLLAGHLAHDLPVVGRPARPAATRVTTTPAPEPGFQTVKALSSEEQFLGEIELALEGPGLPVLQPLNDLTPQ